MLKKHMAACLIATAFVAAPAFAQAPPSAGTDRPTASGTGTTTSGSPAMQPAPSANSGSGSTGSPAATNLGSTSSSSGMGAAGSSPMGTGSSGAGGIGGTAPIGTAGTASPPPPAPGAPPAATATSPAPAPAPTATAPTPPPPSATASTPPAPPRANDPNAQGLGAVGSQPGTPQPATTAQGGSQGNRQGQFVTQLQDQQIMASKMIGTTIVSANNESIGDINDVVVDRQGKAVAVVIGVGGFLGIGEKDVAVPFEALEFTASTRQGAQASNNAGAGVGPANNDSRVATTGSTMSNQQDTATNRQTATTGNTGNAGSGGAAQANANNDGNLPDRIMLRMTKADLQNAPAFRTSRRGSGDSNTQKQ